MSANTWYIISLVGYFSAFVGLVITIVIYVRLNILDVIGDLTGKTVAKELKSMREKRSAKSGTIKEIKKAPGKNSNSRGGKSSRQAVRTTGRKTAGKTGDVLTSQNVAYPGKRSKNGTAEMGNAFAYIQADKQVLHSKTDKLSKETEKLYEDFDPRVEYSRTDILEETADTVASEVPMPKRGTDILTESEMAEGSAKKSEASGKATEVLAENGTAILPAKGTEILKPGTVLLDENTTGGTVLLCEDEPTEPVKFSVTRSYLIVHSEEKIL